MCGIAGCVGHKNAVELVLKALELLEYRGYDSCGIAVADKSDLRIRKTIGDIKALKSLIERSPIEGCCAIGHTRWATHGKATEKNAHPHKANRVAIVHNGIIENHEDLRKVVLGTGRKLESDTDSELIAHLIDLEFENTGDPLEATRRATKKLSGSFAICSVFKGYPDLIVVAKRASPLVLGFNGRSSFVASDAHAIANFCNSLVYLDDDELARISPSAVEIIDKDGRRVSKRTFLVKPTSENNKADQHEHHMHKEIFEQPNAVWNTIKACVPKSSNRFLLPELDKLEMRRPKRIHLVACGTAYHAGLIGRVWLEKWAKIPTNCEHASEFRYREPVLTKDDLLIAVSQSGETADTIGAQRYAKSKGAKTLAICNVINSTLARESDAVIYTRAGSELAVASTKAFVAQIAALYLISVKLFKANGANKRELIEDLMNVPELIKEALDKESEIVELAKKFANMRFYIFLGRQLLYPIAIEGALKLKEISYHFAEGYPAGEMKHGPIALADDGTLAIGLLSLGTTYEKTLSNLYEIRSRGAKVLGITFDGDERAKSVCDEILYLPRAKEHIAPFVYAIPLQLFAYHVAKNLGRPIDKPRNLAKSVTVE